MPASYHLITATDPRSCMLLEPIRNPKMLKKGLCLRFWIPFPWYFHGFLWCIRAVSVRYVFVCFPPSVITGMASPDKTMSRGSTPPETPEEQRRPEAVPHDDTDSELQDILNTSDVSASSNAPCTPGKPATPVPPRPQTPQQAAQSSQSSQWVPLTQSTANVRRATGSLPSDDAINSSTFNISKYLKAEIAADVPYDKLEIDETAVCLPN